MESNPIDDRFYLGSRDGIIVSIPNDRTSTASWSGAERGRTSACAGRTPVMRIYRSS